MKNLPTLAPLMAALLLAAGCATTTAPGGSSTSPAASAPATAPAATTSPEGTRAAKSRDGSFEGEVIGKPRANAKFAKLQIGMDMGEVQEIMGQVPDRSHSYESGKRWIPLYFGNDARRLQALYKGEGCLIFTNGNIWGGAGGDLVQINFDASGACYQP